MQSQPYIVCPKCGRVSHNPNDVRERYCGACHAFHDDLEKVRGIVRELLKVRVIVRGYGDGALLFEEQIDYAPAELEEVVGAAADRHLEVISKYAVHMLEFEFPDAPPDERFLRFGTDPRRMVLPIGFKL